MALLKRVLKFGITLLMPARQYHLIWGRELCCADLVRKLNRERKRDVSFSFKLTTKTATMGMVTMMKMKAVVSPAIQLMSGL
ncbi:LOW QUALITY PROTEIN: Hypothetical protein PHPALM_14010 [Phytophthora palmivora]|uniref:Uncharacterized protein n=1 Tax=Phytophthora palmivora TaxID=4796 RepID=A0A2P4XVV2_9STRA|nr:LOW QUALITY PROTEIN: Hypothetical protein PHPALM_14010 [Phytophthora palmivora]